MLLLKNVKKTPIPPLPKGRGFFGEFDEALHSARTFGSPKEDATKLVDQLKSFGLNELAILAALKVQFPLPRKLKNNKPVKDLNNIKEFDEEAKHLVYSYIESTKDGFTTTDLLNKFDYRPVDLQNFIKELKNQNVIESEGNTRAMKYFYHN